MRIKKVKFKNEKVEIHFDKENGANADEMDEYTLKCADKPLPEFVEAFDRLAPVVLEVCEFDTEDPADYTVFGVSLSYAEGVMGAVISAHKVLLDSNSPLNINTPFKPTEAYSEGADDSNCLGSVAVRAIENLIEQAIKYVNGERAQGKLFDVKAA